MTDRTTGLDSKGSPGSAHALRMASSRRILLGWRNGVTLRRWTCHEHGRTADEAAVRGVILAIATPLSTGRRGD